MQASRELGWIYALVGRPVMSISTITDRIGSWARSQRHVRPIGPTDSHQYGRLMTSALQVAAALRHELLEVPPDKMHKLLYYVQGHHLALRGQPAFTETVVAAENGPTVAFDDDPGVKYETGVVDNGIGNVVLYVATRYGHLTTLDLVRLSRAEDPWQHATTGQPVEHRLLGEFFTGPGAPEPNDPRYSDPTYLAWLRGEVSKSRDRGPAQPDNLDALLAKVSGRDQR